MTDFDFYSEAKYISLPPFKSKKRAALAIGPGNIFNKSFKLFTPHSSKARILKKLVYAALHIPGLKPLIGKNKKKGNFIKHFEKKLNKPLVSSVYYPTINDKLVIQVIDRNTSEVLGYAKVSNTKTGTDKIETEKKAITKLSQLKGFEYLKNHLLAQETSNNYTYIFLRPIEEANESFSFQDIQHVTKNLLKRKKQPLQEHKRIKLIEDQLNSNGLTTLCEVLKAEVAQSNLQYFQAFEHGDLAKWNCFKAEGVLQLFDFEYFEEDGIEYLDLINYLYQEYKLLNKLTPPSIYINIKNSINLPEFHIIFLVFLCKLAAQQVSEKQDITYEKKIIDHYYRLKLN